MMDVTACFAGMPPAAKTRVGNGSATLEGIDGRTTRARRFRDLLDGFVAEYGAVGESDLARCRSAATLALAVEDQAAQLVTDTGADVSLAARFTVRLQRVLRDLETRAKARRRAAR